jgi:hypothetical protein
MTKNGPGCSRSKKDARIKPGHDDGGETVGASQHPVSFTLSASR